MKITYIGHSLGGMILSMYIILSKIHKRDHYLSKAILLATAGTHFHANWVVKVAGKSCTTIAPYFSTNVHLPDLLVTILTKLTNDLKSLPAAKDFSTYLGSQLLGGPSHGK